MDLTTRCPECGTTFSASLTQLQLRKGYIRCINCAHIFDGFEAVVSSERGTAASAKEPSVGMDVPAPQDPPMHREPSVLGPSVLRLRTVAGNEPDHMRAAPVRDTAFTISTRESSAAAIPDRDHTFRLEPGHVPTRPEPTVGTPGFEAVEPVV